MLVIIQLVICDIDADSENSRSSFLVGSRYNCKQSLALKCRFCQSAVLGHLMSVII